MMQLKVCWSINGKLCGNHDGNNDIYVVLCNNLRNVSHKSLSLQWIRRDV